MMDTLDSYVMLFSLSVSILGCFFPLTWLLCGNLPRLFSSILVSSLQFSTLCLRSSVLQHFCFLFQILLFISWTLFLAFPHFVFLCWTLFLVLALTYLSNELLFAFCLIKSSSDCVCLGPNPIFFCLTNLFACFTKVGAQNP